MPVILKPKEKETTNEVVYNGAQAKIYHLKRDSYRKARGGKAKLIDIYCGNCGAKLLVYQKDGVGELHRCYLNRIFDPPEYEALQHRKDIKSVDDLPNLVCKNCGTVIGTPMVYSDGRYAFRLRPGYFVKRQSGSEYVDR